MAKDDGHLHHTSIIKILEATLIYSERIQHFAAEWMPEWLSITNENARAGVEYVTVSSFTAVEVKIARDLAFSRQQLNALVAKHGRVLK